MSKPSPAAVALSEDAARAVLVLTGCPLVVLVLPAADAAGVTARLSDLPGRLAVLIGDPANRGDVEAARAMAAELGGGLSDQ